MNCEQNGPNATNCPQKLKSKIDERRSERRDNLPPRQSGDRRLRISEEPVTRNGHSALTYPDIESDPGTRPGSKQQEVTASGVSKALNEDSQITSQNASNFGNHEEATTNNASKIVNKHSQIIIQKANHFRDYEEVLLRDEEGELVLNWIE